MGLRLYEFICESCDYEYSKMIDWEEIKNYKPSCPMCKKKKVYRNYHAEQVGVNTGPRTVGALADRNSAKGIKNEQAEKERKQEVGFKIENGKARKL